MCKRLVAFFHKIFTESPGFITENKFLRIPFSTSKTKATDFFKMFERSALCKSDCIVSK
jgi:hypothetical protein